jgi:2'-5' RNA ligase
VTEVRNHWWWRPDWEPGRRFYTFHFTFEQQPAVQQLAAAARDRLAGFPALDLVPPRWLHLTTQGIGFADEVSDVDLAAITAAARKRLTAVQPAKITVNAPITETEGIVSWVGPGGALDSARDALRSAIGNVWELAKVPDGAEWSPHVSFAYANGDADGGPYAAALDGLDPVQATLTTVDLIRLARDWHLYEWETIASLPLGIPASIAGTCANA